MATYEEIHGKRVDVFDSDPTLDSSYEGQVWYNSATGQLRSVVAFAAWSTTTNVPYVAVAAGATGPQTANLVFSGYGPPPSTPAGVLTTVEYNGSGWTSGGNMGDGRAYISSAGTQTAGLAIAGLDSSPNRSAKTEEYNGSSWSEQNDLSNARGQGVGTGLQTAGMYTTGDANPPDYSTYVENYDGTSWTNGTANSLGRRVSTGNGTQTSTIIIAGNINPSDTKTGLTEEWNGSSWSSGGTVNTARKGGMAAGANADSSVFFGGTAAPGVSTATEDYDGTSWATSPATMGTGVSDNQQGGGSNVNTAALVCNGPNSNGVGVQEYNKSINTITAAAWSSGGSLNLGRHDGANSGTKAAGLFAGGKVYPNVFKNESEEYDGTSWTEGNNLGTARMASGAGTQTAGLAFAGTNGSPGSTGVQALTEEYDGSSWSESGDLSTARMQCGGAGLQTAAYAAGGIGSPNALNDLHEQYDGSSWTSATAMNTERSSMGSVGTTTAGLVFGGYIPPSYAFATTSEEWNGSAWTSGGTLATARYGLGGFGSQTDAIGFAGATPPNTNSAVTEGYDGTAFSSRPSLSTARMQFAPSGSYNSGSDGMAVGGSNAGNPVYANTEEWTPRTETVTAKTLTTG
mgnify:FL=1